MKSLVAYASKTGVTRECAQALAKLLPECTLCDLSKEKPDPNPYDIVVIGSCVRVGALQPAALEYLENCQPILLKRRWAYSSAASATAARASISNPPCLPPCWSTARPFHLAESWIPPQPGGSTGLC